METGIYVRVSTEEQAQEGFSVRAQEQKLKDYARIKEWSIYNIYIDEGISGKNITGRPAVKQMIEDIEKGLVKNVVVFKIDRLTRSTADLAYLIELFNNHDCAFNSLMESIDTHTASGRMFIKIIGIFAEFERENIAERVRLGFERKAKEGYSNCTFHASYGYNRNKGQKIQTINEKESKIIKEIFDMYVNQNKSLTSIAKTLNIKGIPTKKNTIWRTATIRQILTNCNYIGQTRYAITDDSRGFIVDGLHEPIIEKELFEQAQKLIAKNKKITQTKKPREENYYLGFLNCPDCGLRLGTHGNYYKLKRDETAKYNGAYVCINKAINACTGEFRQIAHKKIDKAFQKYMSEMSKLEKSDDLHIESRKEEKQKIDELLKTYHRKIQSFKNKENDVLGLYINEKIGFEEYREMKERIEQDKKATQLEIDKIDIPEEEESNINAEDIILEFNENWIKLTDREKRQFLMKFIKKIDFSVRKTPENIQWLVTIENVEFI